MMPWQGVLAAIALTALFYAGAVGILVVLGRRSQASALARLVPDCVVLFRRLLSDPRVPLGPKLVLLALVVYLLMPIDLVPAFIPVAGQLDDAILVALGLRTVMRGAHPDLVREHWPGPSASLDTLLRLAGASRA
jgi:uncharacterized membrane protein YkvA (DUF1232 family)